MSGILSISVAAADTAFSDVPEDAWYAGSVAYVTEQGLFAGVGNHRFAPQAEMTRAMAVAVLWRHAGQPVEKGNVIFYDVPENAWYADAVQWAQKNQIVWGNVVPTDTAEGTDIYYGDFAPERPITREELAAILYRYAAYMGVSTQEQASLATYPDAKKVSSWADVEMQWCVAKGYICGSRAANGTYLLPQNSATRAQVAAMLMRFCQSLPNN